MSTREHTGIRPRHWLIALAAALFLLVPAPVTPPRTTTPMPVERVIVRLEGGAAALRQALEGRVRLAPAGDDFLVAELTAVEIAQLRRDPRVMRIEQDLPITGALATATPASWGLDRLDEGRRQLDGRFRARRDGAGTDIYIVDSGVDATHPTFEGRVESGITFIADGFDATHDPSGHGTHVAAIAAGRDHGVAPGAHIISVRVLDATGGTFMSTIEAALDWIRTEVARRGRPAVVNLSLGGEGVASTIVDAVEATVAAGIVVVTGAGNDGRDACTFTPGGAAPSAITVAASTTRDRRSAGSNAGPCVDLFAPGVNIRSAAPGGGEAIMSGTSMAAPFVTGAAALLRGASPAATPAQVTERLLTAATVGLIANPAGAPNRLLRVDRLVCAGLPCIVAAPGVAAAPRVGVLLRGEPGRYALATGVTRQWYRCPAAGGAGPTLPDSCTPISGATRRRYRPVSADVGWYLRLAETATNPAGAMTATSGAVQPVR